MKRQLATRTEDLYADAGEVHVLKTSCLGDRIVCIIDSKKLSNGLTVSTLGSVIATKARPKRGAQSALDLLHRSRREEARAIVAGWIAARVPAVRPPAGEETIP